MPKLSTTQLPGGRRLDAVHRVFAGDSRGVGLAYYRARATYDRVAERTSWITYDMAVDEDR
jgi:hypothetical protein